MKSQHAETTSLSPCIGVCELDAAGIQCLGCHRTLEEIAGWAAMSPAAQVRLNEELRRRAGEADRET